MLFQPCAAEASHPDAPMIAPDCGTLCALTKIVFRLKRSVPFAARGGGASCAENVAARQICRGDPPGDVRAASGLSVWHIACVLRRQEAAVMRPLTTQTSLLAQSGQLNFYRSGAAGVIRNDGDVRRINGFAIDVAGSMSKVVTSQAFTPGPGVTAVKPQASPNRLAPSTMAASIQLQGVPTFGKAEMDAVKAGSGSAYVAEVPETVEILFTPVGAEPQQVEGLGFLPGDVFQSDGAIDYVKGQIGRSGELARIEAQLSDEHGVDVKLAFDPLAEEYVMLRPGQPGYDRVTSARDVFAQMAHDATKMGNRDAYREVLAAHGDVA
jgi:hypothetical protein